MTARNKPGHDPVPILIGGCPRSGTTLLGAMLGVHADFVCTPESPFRWNDPVLRNAKREFVSAGDVLASLRRCPKFRAWGIRGIGLPQEATHAEIMSTLVREYAKVNCVGKFQQFWVDHSPQNIERAIEQLQIYPDARFIHVVRDGRAVSASIMPLDWGPNTIKHAAKWWRENTLAALAFSTAISVERLRLVRYEELVTNTEVVLQRLCQWLNVSYDPAMLDGKGFVKPLYTENQHRHIGQSALPHRAEAWRHTLTEAQTCLFEFYAGDALELLGYSRHHPTTRSVGAATSAAQSAREYLRWPLNFVRRKYRFAKRRRLLEPASTNREPPL